MNAEVFAEWLRRQGYRTARTPSSYWYEASARAYQAFPFHWSIQPSEEELVGFLHQHRAIALRYSTPLDHPVGCVSYHAVYLEPTYGIERLDRQSRQNVRTGLRSCCVQPISFEQLARDGWLLEQDTADRQGRRTPFDEQTWRVRCMAAADLPGFEAWGALVDGCLAASLLTFRMDDCCEMISQQCHRRYLQARANNALAFVVTQTMVSRDGIRSIFYALHSLDAPSSVDEFKFRMGYIAKPLRQRVVFHPWVAPLANRASYACLRLALRRNPSDPLLSKAEGMLRFYVQGRRPLEEQDWPPCLVCQHENLVIAAKKRITEGSANA